MILSPPTRASWAGLERTFAGAVVLIAIMAPAAAPLIRHGLTDSNPVNGSTVASVPQEVALTFNEPAIALGSAIVVKDGRGANWAAGSIAVNDKRVTQTVKAGAPAGAYTVTWRVVSSSGHAIDGTFAFNAEAPAAGTPRDTVAAPGETRPPEAGAGGRQAVTPWPVVAAAAGSFGLLILLTVSVRRRFRRPEGTAGND